MAAAVSATNRSGRRFFLQEDLPDLFQELGVDVLALGGLVAGGDGLVAAAAAAAAAVAAAEASGRWRVVVVPGWGLGADARGQREGYALEKGSSYSTV